MSEVGYSFDKIELVASPDLTWTNAAFIIEAHSYTPFHDFQHSVWRHKVSS